MNAPQLHITSGGVDETVEIGRRLGAMLMPGDVLALVGPLGAGKTWFVKGIARGFGIADSRAVTSPTFVLVNEYAGRVTMHHLDAYRLGSADELLDLGFAEMTGSGAVTIVEWADRVEAALPERALWVRLAVLGEQSRRMTAQSRDAAWAKRLIAAGWQMAEGPPQR